jgi:hypothetical protein
VVGTGGSKVESLMYFLECPAYIETARMVVESCLSLAPSKTELPSRGGGFFSPAYGVGNVLLNRLMKTGTHLTVRLKEEDEHKHVSLCDFVVDGCKICIVYGYCLCFMRMAVVVFDYDALISQVRFHML